MSIKFEKIQPGMILYDCHRYTMGNTKMRAWGLWEVKIVSVDPEKRTAVVRWNHNPERLWTERQLCNLYAAPPKKYTEQRSIFR